MLLTEEELTRLNDLFKELWSNRKGVNGSWGASSHGYHPTYIRRGGLLLRGTTGFNDIWVISPANAKVIPEYGDPRCQCNTMPETEGQFIRILSNDDGVWWDILRDELTKMEAELQTILGKAAEEQEKELQAKQYDRLQSLTLAEQSLSGGSNG